MMQLLKRSGRFEITLMLGGMSLFCFILSTSRLYFTGSLTYLFLNWNLFLAFIPWLISTVIMLQPALHRSKFMLLGLLSVWLLFFPNAPYILTDLFHLHAKSNAPIWFDLGLVLCFAWTGLAFGVISLIDIETLLAKNFRWFTVKSIIAVLLFAASFGIYLGRYLRWNSWDILDEPLGIMYDIGDRIVNPFSHPRTWGMTILFGVLLNMMYWTIKLIREKKPVLRLHEAEDGLE